MPCATLLIDLILDTLGDAQTVLVYVIQGIVDDIVQGELGRRDQAREQPVELLQRERGVWHECRRLRNSPTNTRLIASKHGIRYHRRGGGGIRDHAQVNRALVLGVTADRSATLSRASVLGVTADRSATLGLTHSHLARFAPPHGRGRFGSTIDVLAIKQRYKLLKLDPTMTVLREQVRWVFQPRELAEVHAATAHGLLDPQRMCVQMPKFA